MTINRPNNDNPLTFGKIAPHDLDIEKAVISVMMNDGNIFMDIIENLTTPEIFYHSSHKIIFKSMVEMFNKGYQTDLLSLTDYLRKVGELENVGGAYELVQIERSIISSAHWRKHCAILMEKFIKREEIRIGLEMAAKGYDETEDATEVLEKSITELSNIFDSGGEDVEHIGLSILDFSESLEMAINNPKHLLGNTTGISGLDAITHGFQNGQLIIVAARPSQGKSALAMNLAVNAAESNPHLLALFFSLEMSKQELVKRVISSESGIELDKIQKGQVNQLEKEHINKAQSKIASLPLYLDDKAAINYNQVRARARRKKREFAKKRNVPPDEVEMIIFIDYIQLMTTTNVKNGNREQYVSDISRSLKAIAKELHCPIVALAQLSRDTAKSSKKPQLHDLRESGAIEQDADVVVFIYHDLEKQNSELIVAKNRNGALGHCDVKFITPIQRFIDSYNQQYNSYPSFFETQQFEQPIAKSNNPFY